MRLNLRELDGSSDPVKAGFTGLLTTSLDLVGTPLLYNGVMPRESGYPWREPINLEWSADVRFGAHNGLKSDIAGGPVRAKAGMTEFREVSPGVGSIGTNFR
jgi:hypothetical protein